MTLMPPIPDWVAQAVSLIVFTLVGLVVAEYIRAKIRVAVAGKPWDGDDRRKEKSGMAVVISDETVGKVLQYLESNTRVMTQLEEGMAKNFKLIEHVERMFTEHHEREAEPLRKIGEIHKKIMMVQ